MDINYKVLWFEDTEESFETLSRRTKRYIESKNLRCQIDRVYGVSEFDISQYNLNSYEVLVVDLQLSQDSRGYDIINIIRTANYVNDILFYSSAGVATLEQIMKEYRLEGVFLCDRDNRKFMEKIQQLIDKSVRRSENIINIRGIIMDETSEFDSQMSDIAIAAQTILSEEEKATIKDYISNKLLAEAAEKAKELAEKYAVQSEWALSDLLAENEFTSMMRAKLVNKMLGLKGNEQIVKIVAQNKELLPEAFSSKDGRPIFANAYETNVIVFRNKLAHVKQLNAEHPVLIGKICGKEYYCDSAFCTSIRQTLIRYKQWFDEVYDSIEKLP